MSTDLLIRPAVGTDAEAIWTIFHEVVQGGDTFALDPDTSREEAIRFWIEVPQVVYVAEVDDKVVGTYFLKPNQSGLGDHVCNAGYMVSSVSRGRGAGRAMCAHSIITASELGFRAMQFNFVVSTNEGAVSLWESMGFETVGRLPGAFRHSLYGFVDALVMYKHL